MSPRLVSIFYFYLISTIAIILVVIGVYHAISFAVNTTQFDKYPLPWGGGDRCALALAPVVEAPVIESIPADQDVSLPPTPTAAEDLQRKQCEEGLEAERKQNRIDDIKNAIAFTLIGGVLFAIHFPIALRRSRDQK